MTFLTPLEMFFQWEEQMPEETFLFQPVEGEYHAYTWREVGDQARRIAAYITSLHLPPFTKIGILSNNCAHWVITDLAIMMSQHISVPLFPNMSTKSLARTIRHSDIELLFIGKLENFERQQEAIPPDLPKVYFPFYGPSGPGEDWDSLVERYNPLSGTITVDAGTPATIMYTAGTGDRPKGAMHDYYNLTFVSDHYKRLLGIQPRDRLISHLPMAQMAERVLIELQAIYCGASITFLEYSEDFFEALRKARPTLFGSLPHYWEKIQEQILSRSGLLLDLALRIPVLSWVTRKQVRKRIGLDKTRLFLTGGAPIDPSIKTWFKKLGINLEEIYAMTENTCYSHSTIQGGSNMQAVGKALPEVEVALSEHGEVLVRHEGMMRGYYQEPELTLAAFTEEGFLRTGDKGTIDEEGNLKILGSIEEESSLGEGIMRPHEIERKVSRHQLIEQVCVIGQQGPQRMALTVLMKDADRKPKASLSRELQKIFQKVNSKLRPEERMAKMVVMKEPMTVENGLLTPTMKIKRGAVEEAFGNQQKEWQRFDETVIWAKEGPGKSEAQM